MLLAHLQKLLVGDDLTRSSTLIRLGLITKAPK